MGYEIQETITKGVMAGLDGLGEGLNGINEVVGRFYNSSIHSLADVYPSIGMCSYDLLAGPGMYLVSRAVLKKSNKFMVALSPLLSTLPKFGGLKDNLVNLSMNNLDAAQDIAHKLYVDPDMKKIIVGFGVGLGATVLTYCADRFFSKKLSKQNEEEIKTDENIVLLNKILKARSEGREYEF